MYHLSPGQRPGRIVRYIIKKAYCVATVFIDLMHVTIKDENLS